MAVNEPLGAMVLEDMNSVIQPHPQTGHDLHINVLGKSFIISAGDEPQFLNEVLSQYEMAIALTQDISGMSNDPLKVAILTGFMLCGEINKLRLQVKEDLAHAESERAGNEAEMHRIMGNLISSLDQAFEKLHSLDDGII